MMMDLEYTEVERVRRVLVMDTMVMALRIMFGHKSYRSSLLVMHVVSWPGEASLDNLESWDG